MNGFTVKPYHPSVQVQTTIVVGEHAFSTRRKPTPLGIPAFWKCRTNHRQSGHSVCTVDNQTPSYEHLFEIGVSRRLTPISAPASEAHCDPCPISSNQGCSSGRTAHSTPHGAPPPHQAPPLPSYPQVCQALDHAQALGRSYARAPLQATAKILVHARAPSVHSDHTNENARQRMPGISRYAKSG